MDIIIKKLLPVILTLSLMVGLAGAINSDTTYAASKKIHLKKKTISLVEKKTYKQQLIDKKGKTIKATKVKWKSSKKSVAKINKKGKITAVKAGKAKITAKYKGKTYKFTVKVRKPNLRAVKYKAHYLYKDEIVLELLSSNDASKFEIYVSKNNGSFKYYETQKPDGDYMLRYNSGEVEAEGKYSFKIRGVYGKYKGAFSGIETVTIAPQHNTSIKCEPSAITLNVGETKIVRVTTDLGYGMTAIPYGKNISFEWGDWLDNNTCVMEITGDKEGYAFISIYDTKDHSVSASIDIEVVSPKNINTLINYLKENGNIEVTNTNTTGTRMTSISLTKDEESIILSNGIITEKGNVRSISQQAIAIDVDFDNFTDKAYFYYRWEFYFDGDTSATDNSYKMNAYVDGRKYTPGDSIDWTVTQQSSMMSAEELGLKEGADSDFKKAIGYWNSALNEKLGMTLADIGMANCN